MTGRVGRWTGVKKEVVIMLYVLSQTVGCYAANQLPSSDVQQNGMSVIICLIISVSLYIKMIFRNMRKNRSRWCMLKDSNLMLVE